MSSPLIDLQKLQDKVEQSVCGVELWFDSELWQLEKAQGKSFEAWFLEVVEDTW